MNIDDTLSIEPDHDYSEDFFNLFNSRTAIESILYFILLSKEKPWNCNHKDYDILFAMLQFADSPVILQILDELQFQNRIQWGRPNLAMLEQCVVTSRGEGKSLYFLRHLHAFMTADEKKILLTQALEKQYYVFSKKLVIQMTNFNLEGIAKNLNPFSTVKTYDAFQHLIQSGFSIFDTSIDGKTGADILRERDRSIDFFDYKERDKIVTQLLELEKSLTLEQRFLIGVKAAKKWPDIIAVFKGVGPEWMGLTINTKNGPLSALQVLFKYQSNYISNILNRKEVRESKVVFKQPIENSHIPSSFYAWTTPCHSDSPYRSRWGAKPNIDWFEIAQHRPVLCSNPKTDNFTVRAMHYLKDTGQKLLFSFDKDSDWWQYAGTMQFPPTPENSVQKRRLSYNSTTIQILQNEFAKALINDPEIVDWIQKNIEDNIAEKQYQWTYGLIRENNPNTKLNRAYRVVTHTRNTCQFSGLKWGLFRFQAVTDGRMPFLMRFLPASWASHLVCVTTR